MIVYNVTIKILPSIETEWLHWQKQEHIPEVMASGCFTEYKFYHLLEHEETDGITYIIQYFASSIENYTRYINEIAPRLRQKILDRWKDQFIAFRTLMEVVN
jgi:hypothetical protein